MTPDLQPLDERRCLRLLAEAPVGRIVYTVGALPAVMPVRFHLDRDGSVLVHAPAHSELARAVAGTVVAFEASEVSAADGSGWSVTVLGVARVSADPAGSAPASGARRPAERVSIRIRPELVNCHVLPQADGFPA